MKNETTKLVNPGKYFMLFFQVMNRLFFILTIFALYFIVCACATSPSTTSDKKISDEKTQTLDVLLKSSHYESGLFFDELVEKKKEEKKIFKVGYDKVFNALIEIMSDIGNPILTMDKTNGLIVTGDEERSALFETWKDRYSLRVTKLSQTETQVGVKRTVTKKEGRDRTGQEIWKNKASDGDIEKSIMNQIENKLGILKSPSPSVKGKPEVNTSGGSTSQSSVSTNRVTSTEAESKLIITATARIRSEPNNKSKVIATLKKGDEVIELKHSGSWINVKLSSGITGWVLKKLTKEVK